MPITITIASRLSPGRRKQIRPAISVMTPSSALSARPPGSPKIASMISMTAAIIRKIPAKIPSVSSVMSGQTMAMIPVATQIAPSTTKSHQLRPISGTSLTI